MPFYILCRILHTRKSNAGTLSRTGDHGTQSEKTAGLAFLSFFAQRRVFLNRGVFLLQGDASRGSHQHSPGPRAIRADDRRLAFLRCVAVISAENVRQRLRRRALANTQPGMGTLTYRMLALLEVNDKQVSHETVKTPKTESLTFNVRTLS